MSGLSKAAVAGLDGRGLCRGEEVVDGREEQGAVQLDGGPQPRPGVGAVAQLDGELAEPGFDLAAGEADVAAQEADEVIPDPLEVRVDRAGAGKPEGRELLLELGGDEDQEVREVEVVDVETLADVAVDDQEPRTVVRWRFEHRLEAVELARLADAAVTGKELEVPAAGGQRGAGCGHRGRRRSLRRARHRNRPSVGRPGAGPRAARRPGRGG